MSTNLWALRDRNEAAREQLILANRPLVARLARAFAGSRYETDDLLQGGMIGLIAAVDGYDPDRGCAFATYAVPHIRGEIFRTMERIRGEKRGSRQAQGARAVRMAEQELWQSLGREPTLAEVAASLRLNIEETAWLMRDTDWWTPCGEQIGAEDGSLCAVEDKLWAEALLQTVTTEERALIVAWCGGCTQSQLAEKYGVSQAQISRRLHGILNKMKRSAEDDEGKNQ